MDLAGIWNSLNDKCWPLLDALHLTGLFERYHIPPIAFPAAIIILVILLLMMMGSGGPPVAACGDGICASALNETYMTCPDDCPVPEIKGTDVTVHLNKYPTCKLTVKLIPPDGSPLQQESRKQSFLFMAVEADSVSVEITDPDGHKQSTPQQDISGTEDTIEITLNNEMCQTTAAQQNGVLRLSVKDAETNSAMNGVSVTVADLQNGQPVSYRVQSQTISGQYDFTLPSGKPYRVYVQKSGYASAQEDVPGISAGQTYPLTISMTGGVAGLGDLEVCVMNGTQGMTHGAITIQEVSGTFTQIGQIEEADPTTEPTFTGCYVFTEIPAGKTISASMHNPPSGCVPAAGMPPSVTIASGQQARIDINVTCSLLGVAHLRIRVIGGQGEVLTGNATITLWTADGDLIPGTGPANSLAAGATGYTEEIAVPANTSLYAQLSRMSGYVDRRSDSITVASGQHKTLTIYLNQTSSSPTAPGQFTFDGASAPNTVGTGQGFTATISEITYGGSELTPQDSTVSATFGGSACKVSYSSSWSIRCTAPGRTGRYNLTVTVSHSGSSGTDRVPITVVDYRSGMGLLTITPLFATQGEPPLDLFYDIKFNGQPVADLANQEITLRFLDSPNAYPGEASELAMEDLYWKMTADVPYKGRYEADVYIEVLSNNTLYNASYALGFAATKHSENLASVIYLSKRILETSEALTVDIILTFGDKVASGLTILKVFLGDTFYTVQWNDAQKNYHLSLAAPADEACTDKMQFLINGEEFADREDVHVIDLSKTMSPLCPLDGSRPCGSIEDIRRCLYNKKAGTAPYTEEEMTACISSGCTETCKCSGSDKGDFVPDCQLDEADVNAAEGCLSTISSQTGRAALAECADMNNDGKVDSDDLTCLTNVVSTHWYGDAGTGTMNSDGTCTTPINGGFCFDIETDVQIPGDIADANGNIEDDDVETMEKIVAAIDSGVTPHSDMLDAADFNQDGTIDNADLECLKKLQGIDFQHGDILPSSMMIPESCTRILHLQCRGGKGDLNGDGRINEMDMVILKLMRYNMITVPAAVRECADINNDGSITEDDVLCLDNYFSGDTEHYMACLDCEEGMPEEALSDNGLEICGDSWDNNCDGKTDRDDAQCICGPGTPCDMKFDIDGGTSPGVNDGNYKFCRDVSWDQGGYAWFTDGQLACKKNEHQCGTQTCNGTIQQCSSGSGGETGHWFTQKGTYKNCIQVDQCCNWRRSVGWGGGGPDMDEDGTDRYCAEYYFNCNGGTQHICGNKEGQIIPVLPGEACGDLWDNDCVGGDVACPSGDGGGGCLYVYSISDKEYLDHLGYPMSILPSWEAYSYGTMAHMKPQNGKLTVRLSEELPEITNINNVGLLAVDHPPGVAVMPDAAGAIHTLSKLLQPLNCKAKDGEDCRDEVSSEDGNAYAIDLASLNGESLKDIQDELVLEFPRPADAKEAKILLKGSESGVITFVWWKILESVGKDNMETFLSSLGSDAAMSQEFNSFVDRNAKVSVHVWDGSKWVLIGSQYLGFSSKGKGGEALMLSQVAPGQGTLKVKLTFPFGTFSIDQVAADYSEDAPLKVSQLQMSKAVTFDGKDALKELLSDDSNYLVMKKGEWADAVFTDVPASPALERSYVTAVKGHYTYDIPVQGGMTPDKMLWITKLFTDDEFLFDYVIKNYPQNAEAFRRIYNS